MKLYEISKEIELIISSLEESSENEELIDSLADQLSNLEMERDKKLENLGCWVKNLTAEADAIKNEEDSLKSRRKTIESKIDSLKKYILNHMDSKIESPRIKISKRFSESVEILDQEKIPKEFIREKLLTEPKKDEIKKFLKDGGQLEGAELMRNPYLIIG